MPHQEESPKPDTITIMADLGTDTPYIAVVGEKFSVIFLNRRTGKEEALKRYMKDTEQAE